MKTIDYKNIVREHSQSALFPNGLIDLIISRIPREKTAIYDSKTNDDLVSFLTRVGENKEIECVIIKYPTNKLPKEIQLLTNIKILNLSCKLKELPNELCYLVNLEVLDLTENPIDELPRNFGNLTHLKILELAHRYAEGPEEEEAEDSSVENNQVNLIRRDTTASGRARTNWLQQEEELGDDPFPENIFTEFPTEILELEDLVYLGLAYHKIQQLPENILNLKNLIALDLTYDSLVNLPNNIGSLTQLEYFLLGGNKLKELPREITKLINLKELMLWETNLDIPDEIINKKSQAVLSYYFSRVTGKTQPINEVKVLVVGQGSVGKTSLIQRILLNKFDQKQNKTEGISINQWSVDGGQLSIEEENRVLSPEAHQTIKLNIWDFGGQEIMHATHQFFLTKRSLYLLVLDARLTQEENRVEYWLKIIQSFSDESPVLIVGNKTDQHPLDIDRTGLQKKYPNIVGVLETSAATGAGIETLKASIAEQVNNLPHVRDLLPETWFTVKTKLEELGRQKNYISQENYLGLCSENEVSDETSQRTLIGFLHDLGAVLHFQDDPRLEALGILNPQWVTNGVYKILNSHALFQNKGVLTVSMLDEILNPPEYPRGKRLFIVDMMKKFELCYDIEADKTFLVPDLLPKDEPATDVRENALAFQYHYGVLPSSVITRFIVRMNEFVAEKVWRTGTILKDGGNMALVKADIEERKIFIWVSGDEHKRHDFLSKIRGQFDAIHKTISKLEVKEMVPVPAHPEAEPVDYDLLLQMEHNNVEVYPVLSGGKMIVVKVREMLSGVARQEDRQRGGNVTNIYVGGDIGGNLTVGDENLVMQNSFNKISSADIQLELKETLKQLADAVAVMAKSLPTEQAVEATEDLSKLVDEVTKPSPNKKWYSVSIEGLIKAAENVEKVGEPVINLSRKVLSLLTGGIMK